MVDGAVAAGSISRRGSTTRGDNDKVLNGSVKKTGTFVIARL